MGLFRSVHRAVIALSISALTSISLNAAADGNVVEEKNGSVDRALPIGEAFEVKGAAGADVTQVDAVFVRTSYAPFGLGSPMKCSALKEGLGDIVEKPKEGGAAPKPSATLPDAPLGAFDTPAIWGNASGQFDLPAFRIKWIAGKDGKPEDGYRISVPKDAFFRAGAYYCLFIYKTEKKAVATKPFDDAFEAFDQAWSGCKDQACIDAAYGALEGALDKALQGVDPAEVQKTKESLAALRTTIVQKSLSNGSYLLRNWSSFLAKPKPRPAAAEPAAKSAAGGAGTAAGAGQTGGTANPPPPPDWPPVELASTDGDPLGKLIASMLARNGEIVVGVSTAAPRTIEYHTWGDKPVRISHVGFTEGFADLVSSADPTKPGGGWKVLKKAPADLPFPGSALTLRDVLELARGRISVNGDKTYVAVEKALDLTGTLKDIAPRRDVIEKLAARFEAFEALLLAAADAARPAEATAGLTGPYVHLQLGEWLKGSVLAGCNSKVLSDQGIVPSSERASHCTKECLTGSDPAQCEKDGGVWPGYAKKGAQPVTFTRQALRSLVDAIDARSKALSALQNARQAKTSTLGATVSAQSGATKETWVGQYLVGPAIGITLIEGRNGPSIVEYAAFRLYPFPNPIEERVYLDWRRFAVEIGLGLRTSGIGPEGRYSGLDRGKLPPLLIGATFQPLPFFNIAGGVMLVDEKRSTLPQEAAHLAALPYFGLSGELNLFDLFANGIGAGRAKLKIE